MVGKYASSVLLFALVVSASGREPDVKEPALRQELLDMQKVFLETNANEAKVLAANGISLQKTTNVSDPATIKLLKEEVNKAAKVDLKNRTRLKKIVDKYGWPGKSLAGSDGTAAAAFLVQQARKDLPLQKRCLKLMKEAPKGEVDPGHVAQLTDTVLIADKKKQLYGTGLQAKGGMLKPYPIEDETNVDKRRAEMGLPPLDDYVEEAQRQYDKTIGKK
jgi:hypothetical protein